jgi:hypothetical protein
MSFSILVVTSKKFLGQFFFKDCVLDITALGLSPDLFLLICRYTCSGNVINKEHVSNMNSLNFQPL